jgi:adenylate cyclase
VITALGHFKEISVLGLQTSRALPADPSLAKLNEDLDVQYVLEGSVRAGGESVRVSARVTSSATGAVLWSRTYDSPALPDDLFTLPTRTAGEVAAAVAQPYGIVFQAETARERQAPPDNLEAYVCTLKFYVYRAAISPEKYGEVRRCLEEATARFPEYATAWALLAYMYIDEIRTGFGKGDTSPAERALAAARTAVGLDPDNVRALQALATALFFNHDLDGAFAVGDRALALNPNDTELLGQIGQLRGQSGQFEIGREMLERALSRNPGHSGFYRGGLAIIAYMQGDYRTALREIEQAGLGKLPLYHGVAAIVYARNDMMERGREELEIFNQMAPNFIPNLWAELEARNIPSGAQQDIADGLAALGVTVPPRPQAGAESTSRAL